MSEDPASPVPEDDVVRPRRAIPPGEGSSPSFGGAAGWTVLGAILPGLGLIRAGRKWIGGTILALFVIGLAGVAYAASQYRTTITMGFNSKALLTLSVVLAVVAVVWAVIITATHLALRPSSATRGQRIIGATLVGVLVLGIAAPIAVAARYSYDSAHLISTVFTETESQTRPSITAATSPGVDVWANKPRLNVLLLGSDRMEGRDDAIVMTDSITLASIDTKTGDTVLASIPRNLERMPFPKNSPLYKKFPNGWVFPNGTETGESMINSMYHSLPGLVDPNILGPTSDLGADALKLSVGEAFGVTVDYYAMINIDGLVQLIDAMGGITLNVNERIPMAGGAAGYIEPGPDQHLNGSTAIWFARSRTGTDNYARMYNQRCVLNAIARQADLATLATRYEALAREGSKLVKTDIPAEMLPMMLELAVRVKGGTVRGLQFVHGVDGFNTLNPSFTFMKNKLNQAIAESTASAPAASSTPQDTSSPASPSTTAPAATTAPPATQTTGKSASTASTASSANPASEDVTDACAYTGGSTATATKR